jgi:hypothetical protein
MSNTDKPNNQHFPGCRRGLARQRNTPGRREMER